MLPPAINTVDQRNLRIYLCDTVAAYQTHVIEFLY